MDFKELLKKEFVILDGGFGTQLAKRLDEVPRIPELVNVLHPEVVSDIHRSYIEAGADIVYSATFGVNKYKLGGSGYTVQEIVSAAIKNARRAAEGTDTLVALDMGPIGRQVEPNGNLSFDDAYECFSEIVRAGESEADLIVVETMMDLYELRAAVIAAKENSSLPVICTMSFEETGRTFTGTEVSSMAVTMTGLGVDAMGANCSVGPDEFENIIAEFSKWTDLPIIAKPNAGFPDPETGEYSIGPAEFAGKVKKLVKYGVKLFGGCCGTEPSFTAEIKKALAGEKYVPQSYRPVSCVCSAEKTVLIDKPLIVGERINPTGKKVLKQAIREEDYDYILELALKEVEEGAAILDVNAGVPQVDEKKVIVSIIKKLQGSVSEPLQIDSGDPEAIEAALRVYAGKAIINSVNGNEESLSSVLPLAAKYGAAIVGLTLDEDGIPKTVEKRVEIAEKIMNRAMLLGIRKEDIYIDCLTLTVSAEPEGAMQTLDALEIVKNKLFLKTILGISNISYGLPARSIVNSAFLQMALLKGLDLAIIDPGDPEMIRAFYTNALIKGIDKNAASYIERYKDYEAPSALNDKGTAEKSNDARDIGYFIQNGLEEQACEEVDSFLEKESPLDVISERLIPVMDKIGKDYESGKIFIPQLLTAARTAQKAFDEVKKSMKKSDDETSSRGTIVIATVKGDVHDIGKNIASVIMDNYGFRIVDLGKDVDPDIVVKSVIETDARLVGLSALMTTTLPSMEATVKAVKEKAPDCRIMVGGAVVTEDYAKKIGADYCVTDAMASVKAAAQTYK